MHLATTGEIVGEILAKGEKGDRSKEQVGYTDSEDVEGHKTLHPREAASQRSRQPAKQ
jgi:hypothetical protein